MIRRQLRLFLTAISFYTRLRVPERLHTTQEGLLTDAIRYLPLIGWITGLLAGLVYLAGSYLFNEITGLILSLLATLLLTGAFHEDGFADVCDGFGGGWTKEKILLIMKDSRVGAYGAIGIFVLLALKLTAMDQLFAIPPLISRPAEVILLFIIAHSLSRFAAITIVFCYGYARTDDSKSGIAVQKTKAINLITAAVLTALPLLCLIMLLHNYLFSLTIFPVALVTFHLGRYFNKWIGGYTGDCLGAVQQITEVLIYLSFILLWKYT